MKNFQRHISSKLQKWHNIGFPFELIGAVEQDWSHCKYLKSEF